VTTQLTANGGATLVPLVLGNQTWKGRISVGAQLMALTANTNLPAGGTQDDAAKTSWGVLFDPIGDTFSVAHQPAGSTTRTTFLTVTNVGDLVIAGNNATKATGTAWINPSDPRLKKATAPYPRGLADVLQLAPITYRYNGRGGTVDGLAGIGLDAEAVEAVFPECVGTVPLHLEPDDPVPVDVRTLDVSPILFALITAVKELAARVTALEAAAGA